MLFKDISCLDNWRPLCSREQNHLHNFSRGYYEEHLCEIILKLDQWFKRRCRLKDFLSRAPAAVMFSGAEPFMQFGRGHYGEHISEIILNLDLWFRRKCRLKQKFMQDRHMSHDARRTTYEDQSQIANQVS